MRLLAVLRRARNARLRDWSELLRAQGALLVAQAKIWTQPVERGASRQSAGEPEPPSPDAVHTPIDPRALRLANAVRRAAIYGLFRPKCLVRAVALDGMLRRAGFRGSRVRIGVRIENGRFTAHAWVELEGHVLGDRQLNTSRYVRLADLSLI